MAKLDNVKVVNETVEYNGFVYTEVEGKTQENDLIKFVESELDITFGAFYLVDEIDSDGDVNFIDDNDDYRYFSNESDLYKTYRKSQAITNDKLTDAEGLVKITLPDGTKLEGTPSDLASVTCSMQKMQAEQVVAVEMPAEAVEGEGASEPVAEQLQIGDYAKLISTNFNTNADLNEIVVINVVDKTAVPYGIKNLNGREIGWALKDHLVKATDAEVLEAKQSLLKDGDFTRVIANTSNHRFEIGTVVKLKSQNSTDSFTAYYLDESDFWGVYRKDLEPLTAEEAEHIAREAEEEKKAKAERAKWAAIGREVDEIKKGDIVRTISHCGSVNPVGTIGVAREDSKVASCSTVALNGDTGNWSEVELIVPVEQRFDTVG